MSGQNKSVQFASGVLQQGFTIVPNAVLLDTKLSMGARMVYVLLSHYAREDEACWPGQELLGASMGLSESSLRRHTRELERNQLLVTKRRGRGLTNWYVLLAPARAVNLTGLEVADLTGLDRSQRPVHRVEEDAVEEKEETAYAVPSPVSPKLDGGQAEEADPVRSVFEAWLEVSGRTGRTRLTGDRRRRIRRALADYPLADVLDAVRGWRRSPHHCGRNEHGTIYNSLDLLLRDAERIERFRDLERSDAPILEVGKHRRGEMGGSARPRPALTRQHPDQVEPAAVAVWDLTVPRLREVVLSSSFDLWLDALHPHRLTDAGLVLGVPADIRNWVEDRFARVIENAAGRPVSFEACDVAGEAAAA